MIEIVIVVIVVLVVVVVIVVVVVVVLVPGLAQLQWGRTVGKMQEMPLAFVLTNILYGSVVLDIVTVI